MGVTEHMDREVVDTPQRRANEDHPLCRFQSGLGLFGASRMVLCSICKYFNCMHAICISCPPYHACSCSASPHFASFVLTRTVCFAISFNHLLPGATRGIMMVNAAVFSSFLPNQTPRYAKPEVRAKTNINSAQIYLLSVRCWLPSPGGI